MMITQPDGANLVKMQRVF